MHEILEIVLIDFPRVQELMGYHSISPLAVYDNLLSISSTFESVTYISLYMYEGEKSRIFVQIISRSPNVRVSSPSGQY